MPDPTRAFAQYATSRPSCGVEIKTDITFSNATRSAIDPAFPGVIIWNTDDGGPNVHNGSEWQAPNTAADGWTTT